jgi:hypothetical protein
MKRKPPEKVSIQRYLTEREGKTWTRPDTEAVLQAMRDDRLIAVRTARAS